MKPAFKVLVNGIDITGRIDDRMLGITINDAAGVSADTVQIELDDRDNLIAEPPDGALISVMMGYEGLPLVPMGVFVLDSIDYALAPDRITLRGKAANFGGSLKDQKSRNWDNKTIGQIVTTIAGEHGLEARVAERFEPIKYEYLAQKSESDINFLTRLGREHDALVTIKEVPDKGSALLFIGRGEGKTASGLTLPQTWIFKNQLMPGSRVTKNKANTYKAVRAYWQNKETGEKEAVTVGEGTPVYEITHPHASKDAAKRAAKAKLDEETRKAHGISLSLIGNPLLRAEGQMLAVGLRPSIPVVWSIKTVTHTLKNGGYTTRIEGELPKAG